jgi:RNA polymerase-binding transcription factor DksA
MHDTDSIRQKLRARRDHLLNRRERIDRDLAHRNDPLAADFADQATQRQNDDVLAGIGGSADEEIAALDAALARLEAGRYGLCVRCGKAIEPDRLAAIAYAATCASCAASD